MSEGLQ